MSERRSGVDLVYCEGGWAVTYGTRLLGLYRTREEATRVARERSYHVLAERAVNHSAIDPVTYPRLRSRRYSRHSEAAATIAVAGNERG